MLCSNNSNNIAVFTWHIMRNVLLRFLHMLMKYILAMCDIIGILIENEIAVICVGKKGCPLSNGRNAAKIINNKFRDT